MQTGQEKERTVSKVTINDLLEAGVHFGHQTRRWNPKMKPYIFMERNGIYIIDLQKTLICLEAACDEVRRIVGGGRSVLFVGTKRQAKDIIAESAKSCGMHYVNERWFGGMLTNFQTIRKRADYYENLLKMKEEGKFSLFSKKEALSMEKKALKLEKVLSGVKDMRELPGIIFVVDTRKEHLAVREANRLGIPVIGLIDTNADPDQIDLPVPGNDDAIRAIKLVTQTITDTIEEARQTLEKKQAEAAAAEEKAAAEEAAADKTGAPAKV